MEILTSLGLLLSAVIIAFCEAVEESIYTTKDWQKTIFSKFKSTSYFGPADQTWKRKDHPNKIINWLKHTILVGTTDLWHGSDTVSKLLTFIGIPALIYFGTTTSPSLLYKTLFIYLLYSTWFHIFYHYIIPKKDKPIKYDKELYVPKKYLKNES